MLFDPKYLGNLSAAVSSSGGLEQRLTSELSSGLRVQSLSDDPVAASDNVLAAASVTADVTFTQTATREQSLLQTTDSTLGDVVSAVTSAISLATSAGNGTLSGSNLAALARQVADVRDQVVSLANTSYQGQYLFGGSKGTVPPFTLDVSSDPAVASYQGDGHVQRVIAPGGQKLAVNVPGSAVFTATGADLLGSLNQLVSNLEAGTTANVASDSAALTAALGNVTEQRSGLDSSLSRLTSAATYAGTQETQDEAAQSALLSADPASVATDLQTSEVQHQALLSVIASLGRTDLFSLLQ